jgi:6,7-dimethyl-8-ribityllumazine synthase
MRIEGRPDGAGKRIALVVSRFNDFVTSRLREGALACLKTHRVREEDIDEIWVPGAFEIPIAARQAGASGRYDAIVCLGAVIRGATPHFEYVASQSVGGVGRVFEATGVPATLGILTTDTAEQALERAGGVRGNKGWDAALAALEMVAVLGALRETSLRGA